MTHIYLNNKSFRFDNLPSEPSLLIELLNLNQDDNADFELFAQAVRKDIGLTAKILQVANSPTYRQWSAVTDIERMMIVIGLSTTRRIVISCAIQQFFDGLSKDFEEPVQQLWFRALFCANLSERLATLVGYTNPSEAFLAGLLHQVGMLLLLLNHKQEYLSLLERYNSESANFHILEQQQFDKIDHCQLGAALIENWGLDSFTADALLYQRAATDELRTAPTLLKLLAVAAPLAATNAARCNTVYLARGGELFNLTEPSLLECIATAIEKSQVMATDLGFSTDIYRTDAEQFDCSAVNAKNTKILAQQVKDIALSKTSLDSQTPDINDFVSSVISGFNSLFGLNKLCIFRLDPQNNLLKPIVDQRQVLLNEIVFNPLESDSLISRAFATNETTQFSGNGSIAERQLARLLDSQNLLFVPLKSADRMLGIIAIGLSQTISDRQRPLLRLFTQEIAAQLMSFEQPSEQQMSVSEFRRFVHEVSNPLTIINNYLYILGIKLESENNTLEELDIIRAEIERVGNMLLRARDPQTRSEGQGKTDINALVTDLDQLMSGSLYKTASIKSRLQLDKSIPQLDCNADKLKQILINLLKNAVEAMPNGGGISITTRDNVYQNNSCSVQITISDNGPGISDDILANLFKPVTSTKEGHTGLGLAIINNLVSELNGRITCYSSADQGTEFSLYLPRTLETGGS